MRGVPGWQLTRCIVPTLLRGAESIRMIYRARAGTFFCIFFEDLNITEQIQHGLSADILIGPEGSNLWITFWQEKFKALVIFQNPEACIARCEWHTSLSNGSHPLYYISSASGVWSRIAWWSEVHSFVIDTRKCKTKFSLRSKSDRQEAHISSSTERQRSYKVDEVNFEKVLNLALKSVAIS